MIMNEANVAKTPEAIHFVGYVDFDSASSINCLGLPDQYDQGAGKVTNGYYPRHRRLTCIPIQ